MGTWGQCCGQWDHQACLKAACSEKIPLFSIRGRGGGRGSAGGCSAHGGAQALAPGGHTQDHTQMEEPRTGRGVYGWSSSFVFSITFVSFTFFLPTDVDRGAGGC